MRIEIHGSQGALRFNLMDPHHLEFYDATAADRPLGGVRGWNRIDTGQRYLPPAAAFPSHKAAIGWTRGHVACLANFLQAVAQGHAAEPGLQQGIRVQQLMENMASAIEPGERRSGWEPRTSCCVPGLPITYPSRCKPCDKL